MSIATKSEHPRQNAKQPESAPADIAHAKTAEKRSQKCSDMV